MILGIDFDNTIACYDRVFHRHALAQELIPPSVLPKKNEIRNYLRKEGREDEWTLLQGFVYGNCMREVEPFPEVVVFFRQCHHLGIPVFIISHRTRHPYKGKKYDLHVAAFDWIKQQSLYSDSAEILKNVFFELTKEEKIERIRLQHCTHFIDDLPEFLTEPAFPNDIQKILFDPLEVHPDCRIKTHVRSWSELLDLILGK
jgi:hypothetical protein